MERIGAGLTPPHRSSFFPRTFLCLQISHLWGFSLAQLLMAQAEGIGAAGRTTQVVGLSLRKGKDGTWSAGRQP